MVKRTLRSATAAIVGIVLTVAGAGVARADDTVSNETVTSKDGTEIVISIFRPAAADATNQVPMILHSHGWGGSRSTSVSSFKAWLDAGFGVTSIDQRGHGESGGQANVEDPELEGRDVMAVIDRVAQLDWVKHDLDAFGNPIADDPVLGAIGGSYGGGYQTIGSLSELLFTGRTRFDALAPEITWFDLPESLAPQGVVRTLWNTALYAVGAPMVPPFIHEAFAFGAATGEFPDGTVPGVPNLKDIFYRHSPHWFADNGYKLNIPVLFGQGATDNLFNLNQGLHNFADVLTPAAQSKSLFVGYNNGHVLPQMFPPASNPSGNPCVANFGALERNFFATVFAAGDPSGLLPKRFNLSSNDNTCISVDSVSVFESRTVTTPAGAILVPVPAAPPVAYEIAKGPITVAGIAKLHGTLTAAGAEARAFFALSVGTSVADAKVVQNNVMPLRSMLPAVQQPFSIELPGVAVAVPAGQSLFLTVSGAADMFAGHGSRTPGAIVIENPVVDVPVAA